MYSREPRSFRFLAETKQGRDEIWKLIDSFVLPQKKNSLFKNMSEYGMLKL